jgi:tetratricopeptide (TPR) repeat protein
VFPLFIRQSAFIGPALALVLVTAGLSTPSAQAAKLLPEQRAEFFFDRGHKALDAKDGKEAEKCYRKAIELNPNEGRYHRQLGMVLMNLNRGQEAERELAIAVNMDPNDWKSLLLQGTIAHSQKRFEVETKLYKKVISLLPPHHGPLKAKLEKFIVDDEQLAKKTAEIARKKKEAEDKQYQW